MLLQTTLTCVCLKFACLKGHITCGQLIHQ